MNYIDFLKRRKELDKIEVEYYERCLNIMLQILDNPQDKSLWENKYHIYFDESVIGVEFISWYDADNEPYFVYKVPSYILDYTTRNFIDEFIATHRLEREIEHKRAEELRRIERETSTKTEYEREFEIIREFANKHGIILITATERNDWGEVKFVENFKPTFVDNIYDVRSTKS